jgi:hypothetical protein
VCSVLWYKRVDKRKASFFLNWKLKKRLPWPLNKLFFNYNYSLFCYTKLLWQLFCNCTLNVTPYACLLNMGRVKKNLHKAKQNKNKNKTTPPSPRKWKIGLQLRQCFEIFGAFLKYPMSESLLAELKQCQAIRYLI